MNHKNGEVLDNLGRLGDMLPADVLKMLNELLEQLQQTGHTSQGSKIELVYVASGGQHVETQVNIGTASPQPLPKGKGVGTPLPEALSTEAAMTLWKKAQAAGWVDDNYQPLLSRTQAALLADAMAERLGIKEKWKVFEGLWNRKNMRGDYTRAMNQRQSLSFQDKLKRFSTDNEENTGKT